MTLLRRWSVLPMLLMAGVCAIVLPARLKAQVDYGVSTACPTQPFYFDTHFGVPTAADRGIFKEFQFGYGQFSSLSILVTEGRFNRLSTSKDASGEYMWLRGGVGGICTRKHGILHDEIIIRWDGNLWGAAYPLDRRSCSHTYEVIPDPDAAVSCEDTPIVTGGEPYDGGEGNNVLENPPSNVTLAPPESNDGAPPGCTLVAVTIIIFDEYGGFYLFETEGLLCKSGAEA